jgi:hypothetical protein
VASVSACRFNRCLGVTSLLLVLWGCGGGGGGESSQPPLQRSPSISGTVFNGIEDSSLSGVLTFVDPEGGALQVRVTAQPAFGALTGPDNAGVFSYTPLSNFYGVDTFAVSVADPQGLSASATVVLTIAAVNDAPRASGESVMAAPAVPTTIAVLANDWDIETQQLRPEITTQSPDGNAQVQPDGTFLFTPALGFLGNTQVQYRVLDVEGGASEPVTVAINVRPVKSVAYISMTSTYSWVFLKSPASSRVLGAEWRDFDIHNLLVAANGSTALWQVTRVGAPSNTEYRYIDLTNAAATARVLSAYNLNAGVKLSPAGTHALVPERIDISGHSSVHLQALWSDETRPIHSPAGTALVVPYEFSPNGDFVVYRTQSPSLSQNDVTHYRADVTAAAPSTLLAHSLPITTRSENIKVTPDGARLVFDGSFSDLEGPMPLLLSTRTDGSTNAQVVGPLSGQGFFAIPDFEIASTSRHVAFTYRSLYFPPGVVRPVPSFVVDLQTGGYAQIGGVSISDRVTQPTFNRAGTKVALGISSATETAIYEASVQNPGVLTRVGAAHQSRVRIRNLRYATGDRVVYTADVREPDMYEIFVAKDGQEQRLNADLGTSVILSLNGVGFVLSADGTTVAYAQPPALIGPRDLFLVDVTTPGSPLQVGESVRVGEFENPTYFIVD